MERTHVHILLFLTFINLPLVRSVTSQWANSFEFEGKSFQYNSTAISYSEARDACLSICGVLATVKSKEQIEDAAKHIPADLFVWIGANDIAVEGNWVWEEDGAPATELSGLWDHNSNEPNNQPGENCVAISTDPTATWAYDGYCDMTTGFLCMKNGSTNETCAPTNTAAPTTETSATTNTAGSTTETSATTNTAGSTTKTSATTNTAGSTTESSATALTTSTQLTTSTTPLTATAVTTTTNSTTNAILASTSTEKVPTCKKNGAGFIDFNVLLLLNLYTFNYLII